MMKKILDLSIKVKIPIMIGIAGCVVFALICVLLMKPLRATSMRDATEIAQTHAELAGRKLTIQINSVSSVVRSFSGVIKQLVETNEIPNEKKREFVIEQMTKILEIEKDMYNIWCVFEPNAFDGLDYLFKDGLGSTSKGVFAPWFNYGKVYPTADDIIASGELTKIPKKTGLEFITEPFFDEVDGKTIQMIAVSIPIVANGKYIGVVGSDFHLEDLTQMLVGFHKSHETGKLLTNIGTIVVHTKDMDLIGNRVNEGNRDFLHRLRQGKMFDEYDTFEKQEIYRVYVPLELGKGEKTWFYTVEVPLNHMCANANSTVNYLILYCLLGIALISLAGWLLISNMMKNITSVTKIIKQLSLGQINVDIADNQSKDEIGTMKTELDHLIEGLKNTSNFALNIGKGNLNSEYTLLSDDDILGNSLLEMQNSLQKAANEQSIRAKEEEQRNWGTAGLAKFAEILRRNNTNLEVLSYNVISNLVKYLGANQGGVFVLNEAENDSERFLELKACYAFERKKFTAKQIRPGEGLVGTCFLEGEPIYLTEVPNEYINITSGLGDANPRALLISPLKVNDELYGVIELASFKKFEPYKLEFVQKLSESIAATISTVRINIRTEYLLNQTRLQAEEMSNTEEELRQSMEEMRSTQDEMQRREAELRRELENLYSAGNLTTP